MATETQELDIKALLYIDVKDEDIEIKWFKGYHGLISDRAKVTFNTPILHESTTSTTALSFFPFSNLTLL